MDEAISREAVIDMLDETKRIARQNIDGAVLMTFERVFDSLVNITNALPTIQPAEPKRGKWIKTARWGRVYYCNQCRNYLDFDGVNAGRGSANFCPNCGADMRTAEQIVHDAIDNTPMAEDAYPGIKERLHKAVDDMRKVTNGN